MSVSWLAGCCTVQYIPADHSVNEDDPQIGGSHGLLSVSHDLQTLSEEITQLETITMVTREFLHFLGKY